jgi:hypothetical protein
MEERALLFCADPWGLSINSIYKVQTVFIDKPLSPIPNLLPNYL